jgi:LmbE family N-acetylglucosaminyl deacetylase
MSNHYTYQDVFSDKQNVLVVSAHPDDAIVFFGALMRQLQADGKNVYVVVVTNGARGSRENQISEEELSQMRVAEEAAAITQLGIPTDHLFCLNYKDGEVESAMPLIGQIARYIRKYKADIVCTHEPSKLYQETYSKLGYFVQHRDHRKIGEAVIDAVYPFSRDRSFFTEHYAEGIEPHSVYDILLTDENGCNFKFDYTQDLELKKAALREHHSQFSEDVITALVESSKDEARYVECFNYLKLLW